MAQGFMGSIAPPWRARVARPETARANASDDLLRTIVVLALMLGLANRAFSGWQAPLWLDEGFTAVIATQKTASGLVSWLLHELSGPVFYVPQWAWARISGDSNVAQRMPSFLYSIAAPLLILWRGHPDRRTRMIWAALLALWSQSYGQATEARPYALLTLIGTIQTITFRRLIAAPSTPRACAWVAICGAGILTHYYMVILSTVQGLLYLASAPRAALRSWPAAFLLLPVLGWMSIHLPMVLAYAGSGGTWYSYLSPASLRYLPNALLRAWPLSDALALGMSGTALAGLWRHVAARKPLAPDARANAATIFSGLLTVALVIGWAMFHRSFTARYLGLFVPPILFGLAWWLTWLDGRTRGRGSVVVLAVMCGVATLQLGTQIAHPEQDRRFALNLEQPSDWLHGRGATRKLVFFWDNPTSDQTDPGRLDEVGGYFLRRAGDRPQVIVPLMPREADPNPRLLAAAGTQPGTGIVWIYDRDVPFTRGVHHPDRIEALDPRWSCRDFGRENVRVLACAMR